MMGALAQKTHSICCKTKRTLYVYSYVDREFTVHTNANFNPYLYSYTFYATFSAFEKVTCNENSVSQKQMKQERIQFLVIFLSRMRCLERRKSIIILKPINVGTIRRNKAKIKREIK